MTTEAHMVPVEKAVTRLKGLGFQLETIFDGANRRWLHYARPGKRGKIRVYSSRVFAQELDEVEARR